MLTMALTERIEDFLRSAPETIRTIPESLVHSDLHGAKLKTALASRDEAKASFIEARTRFVAALGELQRERGKGRLDKGFIRTAAASLRQAARDSLSRYVSLVEVSRTLPGLASPALDESRKAAQDELSFVKSALTALLTAAGFPLQGTPVVCAGQEALGVSVAEYVETHPKVQALTIRVGLQESATVPTVPEEAEAAAGRAKDLLIDLELSDPE